MHCHHLGKAGNDEVIIWKQIPWEDDRQPHGRSPWQILWRCCSPAARFSTISRWSCKGSNLLCRHGRVIYLAKKSMTPTKKGISIQNPVRRAQAGWPSSHRKMHVLKSVRTSKRPKSTLKNVNFKIWNILKEQRKPLHSKSDPFWAPIWISSPKIEKKNF